MGCVDMAKFDVPTTQSVKLGNFRGIDYVNTETNVDLTRATEMRNFIHKNKINQKRNGFNQRAFIYEEVSGEPLAINGHWEFTDSYGRTHTIIHAGNKIYKYQYGKDIFSNIQKDITKSSRFAPGYITESNALEIWRNKLANGIKDASSYGIVRGDRLYILCGMYVVYGVWCEEVENLTDLPKIDDSIKSTYYVKNEDAFYRANITELRYEICDDPYEVRLVQDNEDTYVPVVITGIGAQGSIFQGKQMISDEVNMLSSRRRVKLLGEMPDSVIGYKLVTAESGSNHKYTECFDYINSNVILSTSAGEEKGYLYQINTMLNPITIADAKYVDLILATNTKKTKLRFPIGSPNDSLVPNQYKEYYLENDLTDQQTISSFVVKLEGENIVNPYELVENISGGIQYNYTSQQLTLSLLIGQVHSTINEPLTVICRVGSNLEYSLGTTNIDSSQPVEVRALISGLEFEKIVLRKNPNNDKEMVNDLSDWKLKLETGILEVPHVIEASYEGEMVMEVEYSSTKNKDSADKINGCTFGCMFGYNEAQQLFVSGNSNYPNMDWHSSARDSTEIKYDLLEYEDLTYFGELSYTGVGSPVNPIIGYHLLEDSTMAILKKYNHNEPNMFLRKAYYSDAIDVSGSLVTDFYGNSFQKLYYSMFSSTIGEGCVAPKSCANLAGDKLFLSQNGLFAIELGANIKSEERYAKERSRLINNKLTNESNLDKAIAIVFQNRYYLSLGTKIYIADSRFKNKLSSELSDTFSYEFYIWDWQNDDNTEITSFFIKDNQLWFGTNNGKICAFDDENNYQDKMYNMLYYGGGSLMLKDEQTFIIGKKYNIKENDTITMITNEGWLNLYEVLDKHSSEQEINDNKIPSTLENITYFIRWNEGREVRVINSDYLSDEKTYILKNVDLENLTYELYDITGEQILLPKNIEFTLCKPLDKASLIHKVSDTEFKLKNYQNGIDENGNEIDLYKTIIDPSDGEHSIGGGIKNYKNVVAYWYTPVMNMGTSNYLKTTQYLTIVPEAIDNGNIEVNVITRKKEKSFLTQGIDTLNLEEFRYTDVSFDISKFERSFSKKLKIKNFNFIQLFFKSDNDKNCIIKEICLDYILTKRSKGVK